MRKRRAQATVEYMMLISVVSIAVVAVMLVFGDVVQVGTGSVSSHLAATSLTTQGVQ